MTTDVFAHALDSPPETGTPTPPEQQLGPKPKRHVEAEVPKRNGSMPSLGTMISSEATVRAKNMSLAQRKWAFKNLTLGRQVREGTLYLGLKVN